MALTKSEAANFNALKRAAANGHLALLECTDAKTGERRAVLVAICRDGNQYDLTPFGHLAPGNPYEEYTPPASGYDAAS